MIKGDTHANLGQIWYHSEPSDVPYSPNQFLGWDFFLPFITLNRLQSINKIEGTPILKLAMVKRLQVKKFVKKLRQKNQSKNSLLGYPLYWHHGQRLVAKQIFTNYNTPHISILKKIHCHFMPVTTQTVKALVIGKLS